MLIAVAGKSNTGKTTFFSASTLVDAEISNRIFTTIQPNRGVSYVRVPCPCKKLGVKCSPNNSKCVDGVRYVPVKLIDIAGLVPGAHKGKGLGNQFLSDIMEAQAIIHVVDVSGSTDQDGNPIAPGSHDPMVDVEFFTQEIDYWILGILKKNWETLRRKALATKMKMEELLHGQLSGLGIGVDEISFAIKKAGMSLDASDGDMLSFVEELRKIAKPILVAANKIDVPGAEKLFQKMEETEVEAVACSAESELALRKADEAGLIEYNPGEASFKEVKELEGKQKDALAFIQTQVLDRFGGTGVQKAVDTAVFKLLGMVVVYPVANISKASDTKGNVLPDAYLVKKGTTLKEFASKVHSTMAERFIGGIGLDRRKVGADYELKGGDVIEILFRS